jgi:hypothetical protein
MAAGDVELVGEAASHGALADIATGAPTVEHEA